MRDFLLDDLRTLVSLYSGLDALLSMIEKCVSHGANGEQIIGAITAGYKLRERL